MVWWKCSSDFLNSEIVSELKVSSGKGDKECTKLYNFIKLISVCVQGISFSSKEDMAKKVCMSIKQSNLLWDFLTSHKIMNKVGENFTVYSWIKKQGLLPEEEHKQNIKDKSTTETKEQVRPNVRLSRSELDALRKDYPDEKVAQILDTLSKYKTEKGKYYASDYDAIRRWVCRAVEKSGNINQPEKFDEENFTSPFPDWIYGNKEEGHDKG